MDTRYNINEYFDHILNALQDVQQGKQHLSQLKEIAEDLQQLEQYVKVSFETLDHHFRAYVDQVNLLSSMIEFQRKAIHFQSTEKMVEATFAYLKGQVSYDGAFFLVKSDWKGKKDTLLTADSAEKKNYQKFLQTGDSVAKIRTMLHDKDLGILLKNVQRSELRDLPWEILGAHSAILFPLRVQREFFGFGLLYRKKEPLVLDQMTLINLVLGLMTLLLFQHLYFFRIRRRLISRLKLQKIFEGVKFGDFFDKGPLYIYSLDDSGVVLHANTTAHQIQPDRTSPVGAPFSQLLPAEQQSRFREELRQLAAGQVRQLRLSVQITDAEERIWQCLLTRIALNEQFTLNILLAVDITLDHFREEVEKRNEILDQIGQFSEVINRHLNDLMTVLVPGVSLLRNRHSRDEVSQKQLAAIEQRLEKTNRLLTMFMNFSVSEIEQPRRIQLNKLILSVGTQWQEKCPPQVRIQYALGAEIPPIPLYARRMARLMEILIENGLESLPSQGGTIRLSTRLVKATPGGALLPEMFPLPAGTYLELAVSDTGRGIPSDHIPHIFKPFFSTKVKNQGSGLGLFVAYNIIKSLSGEIFVKSKPGKGSVFYVYLPVKGAGMTYEKASNALTGKNGKNDAYILVVDDEFNIRNILKEVLEQHGFRVLTAENGKEALALYDRYGAAIELIILDMVMPVMNGRETFQEIKKRNKDQKVLIMSGYLRREEVQEILNAGALGFISKPFQLEDILNRIKSVMVSAG